jgi:hypothetical protein
MSLDLLKCFYLLIFSPLNVPMFGQQNPCGFGAFEALYGGVEGISADFDQAGGLGRHVIQDAGECPFVLAWEAHGIASGFEIDDAQLQRMDFMELAEKADDKLGAEGHGGGGFEVEKLRGRKIFGL